MHNLFENLRNSELCSQVSDTDNTTTRMSDNRQGQRRLQQHSESDTDEDDRCVAQKPSGPKNSNRTKSSTQEASENNKNEIPFDKLQFSDRSAPTRVVKKSVNNISSQQQQKRSNSDNMSNKYNEEIERVASTSGIKRKCVDMDGDHDSKDSRSQTNKTASDKRKKVVLDSNIDNQKRRVENVRDVNQKKPGRNIEKDYQNKSITISPDIKDNRQKQVPRSYQPATDQQKKSNDRRKHASDDEVDRSSAPSKRRRTKSEYNTPDLSPTRVEFDSKGSASKPAGTNTSRDLPKRVVSERYSIEEDLLSMNASEDENIERHSYTQPDSPATSPQKNQYNVKSTPNRPAVEEPKSPNYNPDDPNLDTIVTICCSKLKGEILQIVETKVKTELEDFRKFNNNELSKWDRDRLNALESIKNQFDRLTSPGFSSANRRFGDDRRGPQRMDRRNSRDGPPYNNRQRYNR